MRPGPCHARPEEAQAASLGAGSKPGHRLRAMAVCTCARTVHSALPSAATLLIASEAALPTGVANSIPSISMPPGARGNERPRLRSGLVSRQEREPEHSTRHASCVAALPSDRALPDPDLSGRGLASAESGVAPGRVSCGGGGERRATTSPPHAHAAHHAPCERYRSGWLGRRGCTSRAGLARRRGSSSA